VDPNDYQSLLDELETQQGATTLALRYKLACKAFEHTAAYDRAIADYLADQTIDNVSSCYSF
jgi:phosphoribosylaminoimidazolecarboxamide formyltransferase/IMP cyclohydrolase